MNARRLCFSLCFTGLACLATLVLSACGDEPGTPGTVDGGDSPTGEGDLGRRGIDRGTPGYDATRDAAHTGDAGDSGDSPDAGYSIADVPLYSGPDLDSDCEPATTTCSGDELWRCAADGSRYAYESTCPDGCLNGSCRDNNGDGTCDSVDLLFVVDNSVSMGPYQQALALAFPQFARTLAEQLPPLTNVHIGVTSTQMADSADGNTTIINGVCEFSGDDEQPPEAFYVTPDVEDTGVNGAQGRLYLPPDASASYAVFNTSEPATVEAAVTWFESAVTIGTGGANVEMLSAAAAWALHPVNRAGANAGFLRDGNAVLALFFVQDEPDQTPLTTAGEPTIDGLLDIIAEAKAGCGGLACVLVGGFLEREACLGQRPIDGMLDALPDDTHVRGLPDRAVAQDDPAAAAAEMNELLASSLAAIIASKCSDI